MGDIKVIFFDMGNTLLHFHVGKTDKEKDDIGIQYLTEHLKSFNSNIEFAKVKVDFFDKWMEGIARRKETNMEYPIEEYLNAFLNVYDITFDLKQCVEAINIYYRDYIKHLYYDPYTFDILKELRQRGYRLGIISNTCYYDEIMHECFKHAGLYDLIDHFTFSYSLRIGKPRKEIFEHAIKKFNIDPSDAIMVGDSLASDIKPAMELGMTTIWLNCNSSTNSTNITPKHEIQSLGQLLGTLTNC